MAVLALDTALNACSVAIGIPDGHGGYEARANRFQALEKGHGEVLFPMLQVALVEADLQPGAITRIVVTTGPGHFTGARVGLSAARAMALALDVPCLGISTLEALLRGLPEAGMRAAVLDARRDRLHLLMADEGGLGRPDHLGIEDAVDRIAGWTSESDQRAPVDLIGSGAGLLAQALAAAGLEARTTERQTIDPAWLFAFADQDPATRVPNALYLRAPDAVAAEPPPWARAP